MNDNKLEHENNKHNRSVMATVTMYSCSNQKYKRIASKDSRIGVGKKSSSITQQSKKKNSLNTFLSTSTKLKSSGNYE